VLGLIGCMAERLKGKMFEESAVDIIAGPDALRSVPILIDLFLEVGWTALYHAQSCDASAQLCRHLSTVNT
jgi:hypothetical protein